MKLINYIFNPDSEFLDYLWAFLLFYIPASQFIDNTYLKWLYLFHFFLLMSIGVYHLFLFFKSFSSWIENMSSDTSKNSTTLEIFYFTKKNSI